MKTKKQKTQFFTRDRSFYQRFFKLLFFIAFQNLIVYSVNLADNIMLGSYSENALAGASLVNQIHFLLQMIVAGCGEGMMVLTAQYWGSKDLKTLKKVCSITVRIAMIGSLLLMLVCMLLPRPILSLLTVDQDVIEQGVQYLQILSFSFLVFAASNILLNVLRSVENVKIGMVISFSALIVNVSLNYCLIFGNFGFPELGIRGAAIATLISRIVELLIVLVYLKWKEKVLNLTFRDLLSFEIPLFKDFIRVSTPAVVTSGIWGMAMLIQSAILGHLGVSATAASSVATTVFSILTVVIYGASSSAGVIVGSAVGNSAVSVETIKQYAKTLQVIFLTFGLITGLAMYASRGFVITMFTDLSEETKILSDQFLSILSITVVGSAYQASTLGGIIKAGGSPKVQMVNDMISMWGIVLPLSLLGAFVFNWSSPLVFFILKSDQLFKSGTAFVVCNRFRWIKRWVHDEEKA